MIEQSCKKCFKKFNTYPSRVRVGKGTFCSKECYDLFQKGKQPWNTGIKSDKLSLSKQGAKNPMWIGGVTKKEGDRKYALSENGKASHKKANKKYEEKEENKQKRKLWQKNHTLENTHYKLRRNISNAIWCKMNRGRGYRKDARISQCLPYTIHELKEHLEGHFLPGMNWNNYGQWHIDHIIPDWSFTYTSTGDIGFQQSWALTNLQPLWAKDNLLKGKRILKN